MRRVTDTDIEGVLVQQHRERCKKEVWGCNCVVPAASERAESKKGQRCAHPFLFLGVGRQTDRPAGCPLFSRN